MDNNNNTEENNTKPIQNRRNHRSEAIPSRNPYNYYQQKRTVVVENEGEEYRFDTTVRCQFRTLKKLIQSAQKIKRSLIIFLNSAGEEIKDCDDMRLAEVFPDEEVYRVKIKLAPRQVDLNSSRRKIYLENFCELHTRKYLGMYCFTCAKSFCTVCLEQNLHKGHNYMEKIDYLQNSKFLVDESFHAITNTINSTDYSLNEKCEQLLENNEKYFESVIEMIKSLKHKSSSLIINYTENSKKSFKNLKTNLETIKETCTESLEELKEKLIIENVVCCEETFLEFNNKYRSLKEEEKRIEAEKRNYDDILLFFETIAKSVNGLYGDINNFVSKKQLEYNRVLDSSSIEEKVVKQISELDLSRIQNRILENVKEGFFKNPNTANQNKSKYEASNLSILTNSNLNESQIGHAVNSGGTIGNAYSEVESKQTNVSHFNAFRNPNLASNLNNPRSNLNNFNSNGFLSIQNQKQEFQEKQEASANLQSAANNINNNNANVFSNLISTSPNANFNNAINNNVNNLANRFQARNPNSIFSDVCEKAKNNQIFKNSNDDNCWKMASNSTNRNNYRASFDNALNKTNANNNSAIQGLNQSQVNFNALNNTAANPRVNNAFNNLNSNNNKNNINPDYADNLINSGINICANVENNKLEIDISINNINNATIDLRDDKQHYANIETGSNEKGNQIFNNIPIVIEKPAANLNLNDLKPDKMDLVTSDKDEKSGLLMTTDPKADTKREESKNEFDNNAEYLKKANASSFYESISKINSDLLEGKVRKESFKDKMDIASPKKNFEGENKVEEQICVCSKDLFESKKKYWIFAAPIPNTNKIRVYHENIVSADSEDQTKASNLTQNDETDEAQEKQIFSETCDTEISFAPFCYIPKKTSKNNNNLNNNNTNKNKNNSNSSSEQNAEGNGVHLFFNNAAIVNKVNENNEVRKLFLYIGGGNDPTNKDEESARFMRLNFSDRKVTWLPNMLESRSQHSMIEYNSFIYAIGGNGKNTCEKFDIKSSSWTKMANLKQGERRNPGLFFYKDWLYAFFGWNKTGCMDSIERINILLLKSQWDPVPYKKEEKMMNLGIYGFAIFPNKTNNKTSEIFILGGKNESETLDSIVRFDFSNAYFSFSTKELTRRSFFIESQLVKLSEDYYGHFDSEQFSSIVRLN